ncbi:hypothetical protein B7463_g6203, partial [Scytalidium lignicola]
MLVRAHAHPDFQKHIYMISMALHIPSVLDALLACTASHLAVKMGDKEFQTLASKYYTSAIRGTRKKLNNENVTGTEDWLFTSMIFFYLYEKWSPNQICNAACHIRGAIQLLGLRQKAFHNGLSEAPLSFQRITAESLVYHMTTLSLFNEDLDDISEDFLFEQLQGFLSVDAFPNSSTPANSPVLGSSADIWRIVLLVARLTHCIPLAETELSSAEALSIELRTLYTSLATITETDTTYCTRGQQFYIVALRILLLIISDLNVGIDSRGIQSLVVEAVKLLRSGLTYTLCNHIATIRGVLADMWERSYSGYVMKASQTLDVIWRRSSPTNGDPTSTSTMKHEERPVQSCLDILIKLRWAKEATA